MLSCFRDCKQPSVCTVWQVGESTAWAAPGLRREVWPRVEAVAWTEGLYLDVGRRLKGEGWRVICEQQGR